jgi:hypothetical protein
MRVIDNLDVSLQDDELLGEIRLATTLMIAAGRRERRLTSAEVDRLLELGAPLPSQRSSGGTSRRSPA